MTLVQKIYDLEEITAPPTDPPTGKESPGRGIKNRTTGRRRNSVQGG